MEDKGLAADLRYPRLQGGVVGIAQPVSGNGPGIRLSYLRRLVVGRYPLGMGVELGAHDVGLETERRRIRRPEAGGRGKHQMFHQNGMTNREPCAQPAAQRAAHDIDRPARTAFDERRQQIGECRHRVDCLVGGGAVETRHDRRPDAKSPGKATERIGNPHAGGGVEIDDIVARSGDEIGHRPGGQVHGFALEFAGHPVHRASMGLRCGSMVAFVIDASKGQIRETVLSFNQ